MPKSKAKPTNASEKALVTNADAGASPQDQGVFQEEACMVDQKTSSTELRAHEVSQVVSPLSDELMRRDLVLGDKDPRDAQLHERIIDEQQVWSGRIFDINRLQVALPDGRPAVRDVVRHPGAVAVVALTQDQRVVLVRQYRTALDRVTVEIPAGKLDPGEDPLEAARRELLEETGVTAGKIGYLTTMATSDGFCDELIHLYMATDLRFSQSNPDDDEFLHVDLVPIQQLIDAVLDSRIEDGKTALGALICDALAHRLNA